MPKPRAVAAVVPPTIEEYLHRALDCSRLLTDVWALHAAAPDYLRADWSEQSSASLAALCRETADAIRGVLDVLPGAVLNQPVLPASKRQRRF